MGKITIRKGGFWAVRQSFFLTVMVGLVNYVRETPKREKLAHYQAWQMINLAKGQTGSGARIEALQDLNKDGVSLAGLDVSSAYLQSINLQNAQLYKANFNKTNLDSADLRNADLRNADLRGADLLGADLRGINLYSADLEEANFRKTYLAGADLTDANLHSADLSDTYLYGASLYDANIGCIIYCTNFKGAKYITPEQIKQAKNWQSACYDPGFRKQLGLPPQNPKCIGEKLVK
jgi:BTB/POZ domain-containing protein KCTD9